MPHLPLPLLLTLGLHMAGAILWLMISIVLGWGGDPAASKRMFRVQMLAAAVAVFTGGGLWQMLHSGGAGPREIVLGIGAVCAIAAAGVQGAMAGGPARRLTDGEEPPPKTAHRILLGQRIGSGLLAVCLLCMIGERMV